MSDGRCRDAQKAVHFEARAPHQGSVDVGLGQQVAGVFRFDAAAILDADRLRSLGIVATLDQFAKIEMSKAYTEKQDKDL